MTFKDLRIAHGFTVGELARKSGVPQDTVQNLNRGATAPENMRLGTAVKLAVALGLDLETFCTRLDMSF